MFSPLTHSTDLVSTPYKSLSMLTTLHLVDSYFPNEGRLITIGSSRYTLDLATKGYEVTLVGDNPVKLDLTLACFAEAKLYIDAIIEADAGRLPMVQTEAYDCALLIGPMYGALTERSRAQILGELYRLLKPGSIALISYLNSWGLLKRTVTDFAHVVKSPDTIYEMFDAGVHGPWYWTTPPAAQRELHSFGFNVISYAAAEGYLAGMQDEVNGFDDEERLNTILTTAIETSEHPAIRSMGEHLLFVVEKP